MRYKFGEKPVETKIKSGLGGMCKTERELSFEPYSDLTCSKIPNKK
jgi:hypothetical protein